MKLRGLSSDLLIFFVGSCNDIIRAPVLAINKQEILKVSQSGY